ncbi:hypothetical protein MWU54_05760 [Marivita sp. S6314]|uniref:NepR family anti-sigma factor n=1 Tax=Marivita sp. S6314 TaxID=2926406 RepID=UPI001FF6D925|nr:NepR family anti-sigma factor [Marivita sp. S6314]MCK0149519.1 hypothetical protein [Marivita sp. S6314]
MNQHKSRSSFSDDIEANLKRAFDEVSREEVPDRFTDLLAQLRNAEKSKASQESRNDD